MGERSFAEDVKQLGYGEGHILKGEGILAITKALLQSGVSYVGGYPGAPISHLLDVMADANDSLLAPMGIYFELSGSEAAAAALLGASINYPMRGAVTWKSVVGTNVASDALSHVASAGVTGSNLAAVQAGEDTALLPQAMPRARRDWPGDARYRRRRGGVRRPQSPELPYPSRAPSTAVHPRTWCARPSDRCRARGKIPSARCGSRIRPPGKDRHRL